MKKGNLMSKREKEIEEELEEISGISIREFKRFQQDHDYPYRVGAYNRNDVFDRISTRIREIDKEIYKLREKVFGILDQLMFIPSWSNLIGSKFNGFYLNQPVQKVLQDNVILLPDIAITGFEETTGEPYFLITGLGLYWVKFELGAGSLVTDFREITGIVLPLDIYEKAQDEAGSVLNSEKMLMTEYLTSIPFSIILAASTTQMYLRGVLARNVFLSTQIPLYSNELLTQKSLGKYSSLIAGIKNTQPKLNKILTNLQLGATEKAFFAKVLQMKSEFREIGRKYLLDWVPGYVS
jgi:hypothetical protein